MKSENEKLSDIVLIALGTAPVLGVLMGGIYSWPLIRLTGGREPWLSLTLSLALGVTVGGLGWLMGTPAVYLAAVWLLAVGLLQVVRLMHGDLHGNLERFGMVHSAALMMTILIEFFVHRGHLPA